MTSHHHATVGGYQAHARLKAITDEGTLERMRNLCQQPPAISRKVNATDDGQETTDKDITP